MRIHVSQKHPEELQAYFAQKATQLEAAADAAVLGTTIDVQRLGRVQTGAALSPRAANTLTHVIYPRARSGSRLGIVGYVHGRWWRRSAAGKGVDVLKEFETGATIRPQRKKWLAIPLATAGKYGYGMNNRIRRTLSPKTFEMRSGLKLQFIERPGKNPLLVATGARVNAPAAPGKGYARKTSRKKANALTRDFVPIFVLVKQSRLPKMLDFTDLAERSGPGKLHERMLIELGKRYG